MTNTTNNAPASYPFLDLALLHSAESVAASAFPTDSPSALIERAELTVGLWDTFEVTRYKDGAHRLYVCHSVGAALDNKRVVYHHTFDCVEDLVNWLDVNAPKWLTRETPWRYMTGAGTYLPNETLSSR